MASHGSRRQTAVRGDLKLKGVGRRQLRSQTALAVRVTDGRRRRWEEKTESTGGEERERVGLGERERTQERREKERKREERRKEEGRKREIQTLYWVSK